MKLKLKTDSIYEVVYLSEIDKNIERFVKKKKFKQLPLQIEELEEKLSKGNFDNPPIWHSDNPVPYDVYKLRLPNPDANVGKLHGYRVVYAVVSHDFIVVLITVYYKKEQTDVTEAYIRGLIDAYFLENTPIEDAEDE